MAFSRRLVEFRKIVRERGDALRALSQHELLVAGGQPAEEVTVQGRKATVATIVESTPDGSLRVVVQGFMPSHWLPFGSSVALDGFYKRADETVEAMQDEDFHEFD